MRTAHLQIIHASVITPVGWRGGVPEVNKFEQVFSDGHQISLPMVSGLMSGEGPTSDVLWWGGGSGGLHSEVQGIMGNGHMGSPLNRMTDRHL